MLALGACRKRQVLGWCIISLPLLGIVSAFATAQDKPRGAAAPPAKPLPQVQLKTIHVIKAHQKYARDLDFSPDGKLLASTGDGKVVLWDATTGKRVRERQWKDATVSWVRYANGGNDIVCTTGVPNRTYILDSRTLATQKSFAPPHDTEFFDIAVTPDGARFASELSRTKVLIWDARGRKKISEIEYAGIPCPLSRCAFSPSGKHIAVAVDYDDVIRICDVLTGKEVRKLRNFNEVFCGGVRALGYRWDASFIAAGFAQESAVRAWNPETGEALWQLTWDPDPPLPKGHTGLVSFVVAPDGKTVVAACADGWIRFFEVATRSQRCAVKVGDCTLALSPDGKSLAALTYSGGTIYLWDWHQIMGLPKDRLDPDKLASIWKDLASENAAVSFRATARLAAAPNQTVKFLAAQLQTVPAIDAKELRRLITELDHDSFLVRERAAKKLSAYGKPAAPLLRQTLAGKPNLGLRRTIEKLLRELTAISADDRRTQRAVEVLEYCGTALALRKLQELAAGAHGAEATEEARHALRRLGAVR
jgi:WD40 repeat protein